MQEQRHKDTKHPEKGQRLDYLRRNNPGNESLLLINSHSILNSLSFGLYALFARHTNVSPLVYGNYLIFFNLKASCLDYISSMLCLNYMFYNFIKYKINNIRL
ncbi:hypothetical protein EDEG_02470 [Edhazardia aedis USNM 41457]|uniref:Uncharacterized protein n=1 Tax=Edhazardia aedis (strain USNM 41457) TaxID=1003232 RepID=J9DKP7_EDHAE|nr:hypothetical protein EDEG_02470 [Edhazardia aedis USNM 41457]|eukprot:EJW03165.1 hypothetical protein EDEG_02470 [Edhazardia aedis USNM 41457]